jgi:hypothetical protein
MLSYFENNMSLMTARFIYFVHHLEFEKEHSVSRTKTVCVSYEMRGGVTHCVGSKRTSSLQLAEQRLRADLYVDPS